MFGLSRNLRYWFCQNYALQHFGDLFQDHFCQLFLYFPCEGAIELSILADYYGREIAAYDIQTTRCDLYGQVILCLLLAMFLNI